MDGLGIIIMPSVEFAKYLPRVVDPRCVIDCIVATNCFPGVPVLVNTFLQNPGAGHYVVAWISEQLLLIKPQGLDP